MFFAYSRQESIQTLRVMLHLFYVYLLMRRVFPFSRISNVLTRTQPIAKISWIKPLSPHWKWRWRNNEKNYANYVTGIIRRMKGNFLHITQNNIDPAFNKIFVDIVARCVSSEIVDVIRWVGFLLVFVYVYSQRVGLNAFIYENVLWRRRKW